jgi:hypothetical protein
MAAKGKGGASGPRGSRKGHGAERSLVERYRAILVDRLTREDLGELMFCLEHQFDEHGNLDMEFKRRFEWTLRKYLHEEVLTREITGIEALIRSLEPGDLKR